MSVENKNAGSDHDNSGLVASLQKQLNEHGFVCRLTGDWGEEVDQIEKDEFLLMEEQMLDIASRSTLDDPVLCELLTSTLEKPELRGLKSLGAHPEKIFCAMTSPKPSPIAHALQVVVCSSNSTIRFYNGSAPLKSETERDEHKIDWNEVVQDFSQNRDTTYALDRGAM
ncbi:MAG: hypothetical protein M1817_000679 [Caeruleum heppii]|nr:MAG: hypothetical protein M1817_000679 [Caeruleum heppii]